MESFTPLADDTASASAAAAASATTIRISDATTISVSLTPGGDHDRMLFDDGLLTGEPFDDTGLFRVWPASIALCRYLEANPGLVTRRRVAELGAGTGLPSILCARHLDADYVLATDANDAAVTKLAAALHDCSHASAAAFAWDVGGALDNLITAERLDTLLLADVVYPSKDSSPLLDALRRALLLPPLEADSPLRILCATTCREAVAHKGFDAALRALPAHVELAATDESESDPLYGAATVFIYQLQAQAPAIMVPLAAAAPASGTTWRLAAAKLHLWPEEMPAVRPYHHGWVHMGNERMLRTLIQQRRPRVIVELGSWLGLCTTLLLEESSDGQGGGAAVFAVDRWDAQFLLAHQLEQYANDDEALSVLRGDGGLDVPLYDTFVKNCWAWRHRLFPMRMSTLEGLDAVAALNVPVDLVYIDADHTREGCLADLRAAFARFPAALMCGDDWQWPGVRAAVEQFVAEERGGRAALRCCDKENWWWIDEGAEGAHPAPSDAEAGSLSLSASEPPLDAIPTSLTPSPALLATLDLSRNRIAELPDALGDILSSLTALNVSRNWLRALPLGLPSTLKSLDVLSNKLRPVERSLPVDALAPLASLVLLDLRFNGKIKGNAENHAAIASRLPAPGACTVLLTEHRKGEAKPPAASRDATLLRCQLEPLSTPQLRERLRVAFGLATHPDECGREEVLARLVECYEQRLGSASRRPTTRIAGATLGPVGRAALPELLAALRATTFPGGDQRERPKIQAQGYIILNRPAPEEERAIVAAAEAAASASASASAAAKQAADDEALLAAEAAAAASSGDGEEEVRQGEGERVGGSTKARLALAKLRRHRRVWQLAKTIMTEADPAYAQVYTAVAVTKQFVGSPHIDTENVAPFYGLGVGAYTGGFVCVESEDGMGVYEVDTQEKLGRVDGRRPHWVSPHDGERYSLIYYQTAGEVVPMGTSVFAEAQPEAERRV